MGKHLTADNLRKRAIIFVDWCCMCKFNGKSVAHHSYLLLYLLGVTWVMPHSVLAMLESCRDTVGSFRGVLVWGLAPSRLM